MKTSILALLFLIAFVSNSKALMADPEDYGFDCVKINNLDRVYKKCGRKMSSTELWTCEAKYFHDHIGHVHWYILCGIKQIGVKA